MPKKPRKPNLIIDFDGTIQTYVSGWQGPKNIPDPPTKHVKEALDILKNSFRIVIFSVRAETEEGAQGIREYMEKHNLHYDTVQVKKPIGLIIDDNCLHFEGDWAKTLKQIADFQHWHKKEKKATHE